MIAIHNENKYQGLEVWLTENGFLPDKDYWYQWSPAMVYIEGMIFADPQLEIWVRLQWG